MAEPHENVEESIPQETVVQSVPEGVPESIEGQSPSQQASQSPPVDQGHQYSKEENFARLRETKEQLERENRELKKFRDEYEQQAAQTRPQPDEEFSLDDDDLVEGKVVKKLYKDLKELKQFKTSYEQEKQASIPDRLRSKFSDFDQVVSPENVEKLKTSEPELFASITAGGDLYAKGVAAYKTLKGLGIVKEDHYKAQKEEVHQNHRKPVSAQAINGQGALSDANIFAQGLTPDLKKQLRKEMNEAAKAR